MFSKPASLFQNSKIACDIRFAIESFINRTKLIEQEWTIRSSWYQLIVLDTFYSIV